MTSSHELLIDTLQRWAALYGRKVTEKAIEVWMDIFIRTKPEILNEALQDVTKNAERMPSPGMLTKAIDRVLDRHPELASTLRHSDPACKICHGTGFEIVLFGTQGYKKAKRCVCWREEAQEYKSQTVYTTDKDGNPCMLDGEREEVLYRAADCEEGRECLATMRRLAKKQSIPRKPTVKELRSERNRQGASVKAAQGAAQ